MQRIFQSCAMLAVLAAASAGCYLGASRIIPETEAGAISTPQPAPKPAEGDGIADQRVIIYMNISG